MKTVNQAHKIIAFTPNMYALIERAARICYQSMGKDEPQDVFLKRVKNMGHLSVFEHASISVEIRCSRAISHEIVRHRIASFSQESTRYCNYNKDRFGGEITVIEPMFAEDYPKYRDWMDAMINAETSYLNLIAAGASPQDARDVLPHALKVDMIVTANIREWWHIFELRTAPAAHPQIRELMVSIQNDFANRWPVLFDLIV